MSDDQTIASPVSEAAIAPTAATAVAAPEAVPAATAGTPAKRRPGRPRKRSVPAAAAEGPAAAPSAEASAEAPAAPAPAKRRPGRPRKRPTAAAASAAKPSVDADQAPAVEADAASAVAPAKRRPGRPRKRSLPEKASADASAKPAEPSSASGASDAPARSAQPVSEKPAAPADVPAPSPSTEAAPAPVEAHAESADHSDHSDRDDQRSADERRRDNAPGRASRASRTPRKSVHASGSSSHQASHQGGRQHYNNNGNNNGGRQSQGYQQRNRQNWDQHERRNNRRQHNNQYREVQPSVSREELAKLKVAELRAKAAEIDLDVAGLKKAELVEAVYEGCMKAEGFIEAEGILDIMQDGYGFLRTQGYLPSENDCYVGLATIRRNGLRKGDRVAGTTRPARPNEKYAAIQRVTSVNGVPVEECGQRVRFGDLTPVYPDECLTMEHGKNTITARVIDLVSPIGKGQRGLIVSPPKAGKTTVLKNIAAAISANNPEVHLICLLVDERPEEVTDMERSIKGEVVSSTFDMPTENHIQVAELVIERAKRLVENGKDVVVLLDSLTRLARAYNLAQPASGRILSGGVDSTALYPPKKFLGAARNIEGGGSLTILASALVETGSKMDEVIFEEFKGTGNMELKLDRSLADRRIYPAIDPVSSGTRKEDLLLNPQEAPLIWAVRRILANMNSTERAMDMLIKSLKQTDTNQEFLLRTAKKAQHSNGQGSVEL